MFKMRVFFGAIATAGMFAAGTAVPAMAAPVRHPTVKQAGQVKAIVGAVTKPVIGISRTLSSVPGAMPRLSGVPATAANALNGVEASLSGDGTSAALNGGLSAAGDASAALQGSLSAAANLVAGLTGNLSAAGNAAAGVTGNLSAAGNAAADVTGNLSAAGNAAAGLTGNLSAAGNAAADVTGNLSAAGNAAAALTGSLQATGNAAAGLTGNLSAVGSAAAGMTLLAGTVPGQDLITASLGG